LFRIEHHHFFHDDPAAVHSRPILDNILKEQQKIAMDTSALKAAFSQFATDFSTFATDVRTKLDALAANQQNPADQQAVDDVTNSINVMDDTVKKMDADLNPAPPAPAPAPATT
jgi:hypothetical protein